VKLLLDTQAFLWMVRGTPELSAKAKQVIRDPTNELFLSIASVWEMAIKSSIGKLKLAEPLDVFVPVELQANDVRQLDLAFRHVCAVARLPFHHRDPFDRLLVCQAEAEALALVSADPIFDRYKVKRIW